MAFLGKRKKNVEVVEEKGDAFDRIFEDFDNRMRQEREAALKEVQNNFPSYDMNVFNNYDYAVDNTDTYRTERLTPGVVATPSPMPVQSVNNATGAVSFGTSSVIGKREYQQDALMVAQGNPPNDKKSFAVLCDGMGGMNGGEKASALCVEKMINAFNMGVDYIPDFYRRNIIEIDDAVSLLTDENGDYMGAGSTLISVIIDDYKLYWGSVGDSRIYVIRDQEMVVINAEHNYYVELLEKVRAGEISQEEADKHPSREALTSYMGIGGITLMDVSENNIQLLKDDYVVLCSDGLYRALSDNEIFNIIKKSNGNAQQAAKSLTDYTMGKNIPFQDNTSVIVIKIN